MPTLTRTKYPHVAAATDYAEKVATRKLDVCLWTRLACERQLDDLSRWSSKSSPFYFDAEAAQRVCNIVEHFPHIHGIWAAHQKRLELEPWQSFILSTIFGWKARETDARRFRIVYIEVPRKNAKSTLTSAVGLYLLGCDGEHGGHVVSAANTREQAKLIFRDAQVMARKEKGYRTTFGVEVLAHTIIQQSTSSRFEALSAEHSNLDGLNLHAALIDELHAHSTRGLWDVLTTATGSRMQPLIWAITTAGIDQASNCYNQRSFVTDILQKRAEDETYFGIIYTTDADDDPFEETSWRKANPNYGVSIHEEDLRSKAKRAMQMPSDRSSFLMKHLDVWVNAAISWLPAGAWDRCGDVELDIEDFAGEPCYIGIDLAMRNDIAALVTAFPPTQKRGYWAVFGRYFLPEETINRTENTHFQRWETTGRLTSTPGVVTDFDYILDTLGDLVTRFDVLEMAIDPYNAGPLIVQIEKRGMLKPVEIRQTAANMSPAMIELEGLVIGRTIRHDRDPVLAWMASNVNVEYVGELIKPVKDSEEKKIDGVVALLMCILRGLKQETFSGRGAWAI